MLLHAALNWRAGDRRAHHPRPLNFFLTTFSRWGAPCYFWWKHWATTLTVVLGHTARIIAIPCCVARKQEDKPGLTVGGAVLDRKTLRTLGITLAGGITTLITALLTRADTEAGAEYQDESAANCALSAVQREVIKSVLGNSSCAQNGFVGFNRSLASYLA